MRCTDCETEPLNLARYCECCGREILLHETQAEEASLFGGEAEEVVASGADDWAPNPNPTSDLRYQTCDPPTRDGDRSQPSQEPSAIAYADPSMARSSEVVESAETQPVEEALSSAFMAPTALSPDVSDHVMIANPETPKAIPEATTTTVKDIMAAVKTVEPEAVKTRDALPRHAKVDAVQTERVRRPADVTRRPSIPVVPQRRYHPIALVAVVVFAAIGVGAPWLRLRNVPVIGRVQQLAMSVATHATAEAADVQNGAAFPTEPAPATPVQDRSAAPPYEHAAAPTPATLPRERPADPTTATQDRKPDDSIAGAINAEPTSADDACGIAAAHTRAGGCQQTRSGQRFAS